MGGQNRRLLSRVASAVYDRIDNAVYNTESETWWQPDSAFHQMKHVFNPARVGYAKRKLFGDLKINPSGKQALEIGCGGGILSEEIARMGFDTTGIDPSEPSLRAAADHARSGGLNIRYLKGVGESLPFPDGSFDAVFCCDVLEHVRDLPKVVSEISRVLKTGGVFIYDTFNRTLISKLVAIKIGQEWKPWAFMPADLHVWKMFIKPRELKSLLPMNHLRWMEHQGLKPDNSILRIQRFLRQRAGGRMSYRELGENIRMVEGRSRAVMYMGYAVKSS
ncbi:MAG: bifunctional 2-polyprenyl-6-hydroxyphenol methylase/3-demethylubiquinol 3-O-methyltransferase UbiG [Candidatus Aminicenantes bacterium]|nr:bifunctional 2-polyprenyl-6-hydroxyphenol methylase/3-demethylubiquinol 3-O-methyltransferase UbiG [Candidatus Aminicenantes bacterium]